MKSIKTLMLLLVIATISACSNDDTPTNEAPIMESITMDVSEHLESDLITTMVTTDAEDNELTYAIVSQTPAGSIIINATTGEIYVGNASAFDYEQNTQIVAIISVSDGTSTTESTLTINILDVNENG